MGARRLLALDAEIERVFKTACKDGRRESRQAYAVDALEALVCGGAGGGTTRAKPKAEIRVLVDHSALLRGHTIAGEACEIEGLGPVPVAVVESWKHDAYLRLIVTDGIDVKAVTRRSRYVDAHVDAALAVRDRHCIVSGCDVDWRLERDHRVPYAQCHTTSLDGLGRMCWWHHLLKTKGWALVGGPGCYRLLPPGTGVADAAALSRTLRPTSTQASLVAVGRPLERECGRGVTSGSPRVTMRAFRAPASTVTWARGRAQWPRPVDARRSMDDRRQWTSVCDDRSAGSRWRRAWVWRRCSRAPWHPPARP